MNVYQLVLGAVLLAITAMLPALTTMARIVVLREWRPVGWVAYLTRMHLRNMLMALRGFSLHDLIWNDEGVVAITYTSAFVNNGTSTAPTAVQASQLQVQTAEVFFADGDTQAVIVHNWGSVVQYPAPASWSSYLLPYIQYYCLQQTASPSSFATAFTFGITNTNSITMNKTSIGTGSGGTWAVIMRRSWT